jgi:hypothetical protein
MPRQEINLGIIPGDKKGDKLRVGGDKINDNFIELYNAVDGLSGIVSPILASVHVITDVESRDLTALHNIIEDPGAGKVIELISLVARVIPAAAPIGGLEVYPEQTLNVSMDGDNNTQDWGHFDSSFLMSPSVCIQRMMPSFGTQIWDNSPIYVALSGSENPKSGMATIELYVLYRVITLERNGGIIGDGGGTIL